MRRRYRVSSLCLMLLTWWSGTASAQPGESQPPVEGDSSNSGQAQPENAKKPHLDPRKAIFCVEDADGQRLRVQCDSQQKRCLVARPYLKIDGAREPVVARMMQPCQRGEPGAYARLEREGYELVPALLETRYGYKRDERGRIYQTNFDLRRRLWLGVYDFISATSDFAAVDNRLSADIGGVWETYDDATRRRNRHRFMQGRIALDPIEASGLLYGYDRGRSGDEPAIRIVEFLSPEPDRYDISIHLGPGARVGRFRLEDVDGTNQFLLDVGQGHINWEMLQNEDEGLEDYLLVRGGVGGGMVAVEDGGDPEPYGYPEVGLEGAWVVDQRGLTQLRMDAAYRKIWTVDEDERDRAHAKVSLERVVVSINDQPITVFARGGVDYRKGPLFDDGRTSFEALVGGRISILAPPRPDYAAPSRSTHGAE